MLEKSYKHALGVGRWCGVAQNVRRYFKITKAYPLDWWIVEWEALVLLLEENFSNLFRVDSLNIDENLGNFVCSYYGIQHAHDFERDADNRLVDNIGAQVPLLQEKYRTLIDRMDRAFAHDDVLVVRESLRTTAELELELSDAVIETRACALLSALEARWPTTRIDLLVLERRSRLPDIAVGENRIAFDTLEDLNEASHWRAQAWDRMFARQGVRPLGMHPARVLTVNC